jgi:uncharacterized membrane protein
MRSLTRAEWAILAIVGAYSFVPAVLSLVRIPELLGAPTIIPSNPRAVLDPVPIILHILASSVFCLAGMVQFLPSLRRDRPVLHRRLGRLVAIAGSISALTGLWMTVFYVFPAALQGSLLYWARVLLSLAMFAFILRAVIAIRACNVSAHRAAMLRAYAIAQGASTQTALFIAAMVFFGAEPLGHSRDILMVTAWAINLAVAEVLIRCSAGSNHVERSQPIHDLF